jgi:hypothetical protein
MQEQFQWCCGEGEKVSEQYKTVFNRLQKFLKRKLNASVLMTKCEQDAIKCDAEAKTKYLPGAAKEFQYEVCEGRYRPPIKLLA